MAVLCRVVTNTGYCYIGDYENPSIKITNHNGEVIKMTIPNCVTGYGRMPGTVFDHKLITTPSSGTVYCEGNQLKLKSNNSVVATANYAWQSSDPFYTFMVAHEQYLTVNLDVRDLHYINGVVVPSSATYLNLPDTIEEVIAEMLVNRTDLIRNLITDTNVLEIYQRVINDSFTFTPIYIYSYSGSAYYSNIGWGSKPDSADVSQFITFIGSGHNIVYSASNGTISGPSSASDGDTVTLTITPDTGYVFSSLAVYKTASQDAVPYTKVNDTTYTFVMPDTDVTVTGIFARAYSVSIACSPSTAGTITRTPSDEFVRPGTTVSFTVTPDSDWQVSTMDFSQDASVDWDASTLTGTFIMPERLVYGTVYLSNRLDPNAGGGTSEPEVPSGGFDNESDVIAIPVYADRGVVNVTAGKGLITLWNPTNAEIADIGQYLYSTDWADALYQGFRDFFVKPLESAISLHVLPITPSRSENKQPIRFGPHNSGVSSYAVTNQYATMDLGTLAIAPYWDSYLDYNPFTKIQIYLPYIGTQDIDTDIVMGKTIGVRYKFDVLTGACVAFLYTVEGSTPSIFAEFVGESAMQIPLCSSDYSRVIGGIIQAAATVVTGRMVTGAAMKASNELIASKQVELEAASNRLDSFKRKRPRTEEGKAAKLAGIEAATKDKSDAANGLAMAQAKAGRTQASMYAAELRAVPYEVGSVMGGKATTTISGSVAGGAGLLGSQVPYLLIRRPKQSLPENYKKYVGYPSNIYAILGSLTGYTRIEQADLVGIPCTDAELGMIYKALKEGVYL